MSLKGCPSGPISFNLISEPGHRCKRMLWPEKGVHAHIPHSATGCRCVGVEKKQACSSRQKAISLWASTYGLHTTATLHIIRTGAD